MLGHNCYQQKFLFSFMVFSVLIAEAKSLEAFLKSEPQKFHIAELLFEFNSEYVTRPEKTGLIYT